jgi:hypothetical protein
MPGLTNRESMAVQGWGRKPLGASGSGLGPALIQLVPRLYEPPVNLVEPPAAG